jgi:site-specific recombinase XerC
LGTVSGEPRSRRTTAYHQQPEWSGVFVRNGTVPDAARVLVDDVIDEFLDAARDGSALDRYGRHFTRDAVRELDWCLRGHVSEELGGMSLTDVRRHDVEALVYALADSGTSHRRLRAVAKSVRALYDYAAERGLAMRNPAERVALPDEDQAEQPRRQADRPTERQLPDIADRVIGLMLRGATLAFLLIALVLIAQSL